MEINRRRMLANSVAVTASALVVGLGNTTRATSQPKQFAPRMPLSQFLKSDRMLKARRKGVAAMKARKAYDPLSWFYQAAIHGVPPEMVDAERKMSRTELWPHLFPN